MSNVDPRKSVDSPATNPNRGLNTRTFLIAVFVALVVILLVLFSFINKSSKGIRPVQDGRPHTTRIATPHSHLEA